MAEDEDGQIRNIKSEREEAEPSFSRMIGQFAFHLPQKQSSMKQEEDDAKPSLSVVRTKIEEEFATAIPKHEVIDVDAYFDQLSLPKPEEIDSEDILSPLTSLPTSRIASPTSPPAKRKCRSRVIPDSDDEFHCDLDSDGPCQDERFIHIRGRKRPPSVSDGTPKSRKKAKLRGYSAPEDYAHLNEVPDRLGKNLDVLFCGINPGVESARSGHHFAYKGNNFYRMLFGAGFTNKIIPAHEDVTMPDRYNIGIINLVDRPTSCEAELSQKEMFERVPELVLKLKEHQPRYVCFIGKGMCANVEKIFRRELKKNGRLSSSDRGKLTKLKTDVGMRPFKVKHDGNGSDSKSDVKETLFFCSHSSSGLATSTTLTEKVSNLKVLRNLLVEHEDHKLDTSAFWVLP